MKIARASRMRTAPLILGLILCTGSVFAEAFVVNGENLDVFESGFDYNFARYSSTGRNFATWTDPAGRGSNKYLEVYLRNYSASHNNCYDISTYTKNNSSTADTRIWAQTGSTTWKSVSDDKSPGVFTSQARVWLAPGKSVALRVSTYSASSSQMEFRLRAHRFQRNYGQPNCQSGPFVNMASGSTWPVVINGN
jgi:hypothetical protein